MKKNYKILSVTLSLVVIAAIILLVIFPPRESQGETFEDFINRTPADKIGVYSEYEGDLPFKPSSPFVCDGSCYVYNDDVVWHYHFNALDSYTETKKLGGVTFSDISFESIDGIVVAVANNRVFYHGTELVGANSDDLKRVKNTEILSDSNQVEDTTILMDDKFIYTEKGRMDQADLQTFEFFNEGLAKDKENVYIADSVNPLTQIIGLDSSTLEALNKHYVKDTDSVFYIERGCHGIGMIELEDAEPEHFRLVVDGEWTYVGWDMDTVFIGPEKQNGHPDDLQIDLENGTVYNLKINESGEADDSTFEVYSKYYQRIGGC